MKSLLEKSFSEEWDSTVGIQISESRVNGLSWNEIRENSEYLPAFAARIAVKTASGGGTKKKSTSLSMRDANASQPLILNKIEDEDDVHVESRETSIPGSEVEDGWILHAKNERDDLRIAIFDFGGQRVFYSLHQLFFTPYALYLVVFDASRASKAELEKYLMYWLRTIALHAPKAFVTVIGTFADELDQGKISELEELFKSLQLGEFNIVRSTATDKDFHLIDNKSRSGVLQVRETLQALIAQEDFIRLPVPIKWIRFLDLLLEKNESQWVSLREATALAKTCQVHTDEEVDSMLTLFHELGCLLYFNQSHALREFITLNPQWLIDAIAKLIFDADIHVNQMGKDVKWMKYYVKSGLVTRENLSTIWEDSKVDFLMDLMQNALLMTPWMFKNRRKSYLVPSMVIQLKNVSFKPGKDSFQIRTKDALPMGLFEFLMCLCISHSSSLNTSEPRLYDRAFDVYFEHYTLVRVDSDGSKCMTVTVDGAKGARRALSIVASMLRKIKDELLGTNLRWTLLFQAEGSFIQYQEAKSRKLAPWFPVDELSADDEMELEKFLDI